MRRAGELGEHELRTQHLSRAIAARRPRPGPPTPCPYLPGRIARHVTVLPSPATPGVYHSLMDLNFRRSGPVFYRPTCHSCAECRMLRVRVAEFRPSRAQRRCWRRNADADVSIEPARPSAEGLALYRRYLAARHDGQMDGSFEEYRSFLYASPVRTEHLVYRLAGKLVAVGVVDVEPEALSAVYCFFDPDVGRRSLGVYNVLRSLEECRRRGLRYLYLGFHVDGCRRMSYKSGYRPCERLEADGRWVQLAG